MKNNLLFSIQFFAIRTINFLLILTFYVGIGLTFLFQDFSYLWISTIGLSYFLLTRFNIPILSPIVRTFNWTFAKYAIFKQVKKNPLQLLPTMMYLEKDKTPKRIYIMKGTKAFTNHMNERLSSQKEMFQNSMKSFDKIHEDVKKAKEEGASKEELESKILNNLNSINPLEAEMPTNEKILNERKKLASMVLGFEELKLKLEQARAEGVPKEELERMGREGFSEVLTEFKNQLEKNNEQQGN